MGRSYTPTYTVTINGNPKDTFSWSIKNAGLPTDTNLAKWAAILDASTEPGGCNEHIPDLKVRSATVQYNGTNQVIATYTKAEA